MNRRKTLALIGGGVTFGSLYGVNSMTQPALAANVEIRDQIVIEEDEIDNLAFEFDVFELSASNIDSVEVTLQGRVNNNDYVELDTKTITLPESSYENEDFSSELGQFDISNLNLNTELNVGEEQDVNFKIIINNENVDTVENDSTVNVNMFDGVVIRDWNDLDNVRNDLTGDYMLGNDLDEQTAGYDNLAGPNANGGEGWMRFQTYSGSFDGGGHTISGLIIDREGTTNNALFGLVDSGAVVKKLGVVNADIVTNRAPCSVIAAYNEGTVRECYASGNIVNSDSFTGGLVGDNRGMLRDSYALVNVDTGFRGGGGQLVII